MGSSATDETGGSDLMQQETDIHYGEVYFENALERTARAMMDCGSALGQNPAILLDQLGRPRIVLQNRKEVDENKVAGLAATLSSRLGAYGSPPDQMILYLEDFEEAENLRTGYILLPPKLREVLIEEYNNAPLPYLLDRPVTGRDWAAAVPDSLPRVPRFAFFGIKGGVGRSTALAMWALHLAQQGKRVLVLDLDLESPGSGGMLLNPDAYPDFGLVDWFVEDVVRQSYPGSDSKFGTFFRPNQLYARSALADVYDGAVFVAPSYGLNNGSFITKLGRCYLDGVSESWTQRLARFVDGLEHATECDVTLLDSRAGLHDIAAAATTRLGARTLLFAQDTRQTWASYAFLFSAWSMNLGRERLNERIYTVAGMVPEDRHTQYIEDMRLHAWDCFRDGLYSAGGSGEDDYARDQAYDLEDESAPHAPVPIMWSQALRQFDPMVRNRIEPGAWEACQPFFARFDPMVEPDYEPESESTDG